MFECALCGDAIPEGRAILLQRKGTEGDAIRVCPGCEAILKDELAAEPSSPNPVGAMLCGAAAAVLASLLWYGIAAVTHYQLGFAAVAVGWLVAQATMLGAGRKRGQHVQLWSALITVLAMAFSEYLLMRAVLMEVLGSAGYDLPLYLPADLTWDLVVLRLREEPLALVFWAIAVALAYRLPVRRQVAAAGQVAARSQ